MKVSQNGLNSLTIPSEGLRLVAYDDAQPNKTITSISQVKGTLTIGYGHTGKDVYVGQKCNKEQAINWLIVDMATAENTVLKYVKVPLTQNMFDALCDFVFNAGSGNFLKSTLLKELNLGNYLKAADEFLKWNKSKGVVFAGLTIRCEARKKLFLDGIGVNTYLTAGQTIQPSQNSFLAPILATLLASS